MPERDLWYGTHGPRDAQIVFVGEAWGAEEAKQERPFIGNAGQELYKIAADAGINLDDCLLTNIAAARPPGNDMWQFFYPAKEALAGSALRGLHPGPFILRELPRLYEQINSFPRKVVVACGNWPLWALSECAGVNRPDQPRPSGGRRTPNGIMTWRGSMIHGLRHPSQNGSPSHIHDTGSFQLLPIIHPSAILRQWSGRAITVHDLKARVKMALEANWRPNPSPVFWAPPDFMAATAKFEEWLGRADSGEQLRIASDIETCFHLIACIGFADSANFAMSVPFVRKQNGSVSSYWNAIQEATLIRYMQRIFTHPNILIEGQNFFYDIQYIQYYHLVLPRLDFDTMHAHHLLWPGTPKGLDYLSSLYCLYHWYWSNPTGDGDKEWDAKGILEDLLSYNCLDCIRTYEAATVLRQLIPQSGMSQQWAETKEREAMALEMMQRGVRIDLKRKGDLAFELMEARMKISSELDIIIPQKYVPATKSKTKTKWYDSPTQTKIVFDMLGMDIPVNRKTKTPTVGKEARPILLRKYPAFEGLFDRLQSLASIKVYLSHYIKAQSDPDGRMRSQFKPAGTETFRFSSSKNAFDRGANFQNITKGEEDE